MKNPGKGGRYMVGPGGELSLVECTNRTPAETYVAPPAENLTTTENEDDSDALSEEVSAGED